MLRTGSRGLGALIDLTHFSLQAHRYLEFGGII